MQQKYLNEAYELYDEVCIPFAPCSVHSSALQFFHIVKLPLLTEEVRGPEKLQEFSKMLVEPHQPPV